MGPRGGRRLLTSAVPGDGGAGAGTRPRRRERNLLVVAVTPGGMDLIHVCLNVADAERSIAFYEQFGFQESWSFTDGATENHYVSADNGAELQLSETEGETEFEQGTAWDHLALGVDDVDATVERVDHHGIVKAPGPQPAAGSYTAFLEDPDGHVVELVQPLEED